MLKLNIYSSTNSPKKKMDLVYFSPRKPKNKSNKNSDKNTFKTKMVQR